LCLTSALALAPATLVAPMEFLRLPAIAGAGALFYAEPLDTAAFAGGALILAAILLNLSATARSKGN
jgi:drug/metabolite transporter (DMT)-like permease